MSNHSYHYILLFQCTSVPDIYSQAVGCDYTNPHTISIVSSIFQDQSPEAGPWNLFSIYTNLQWCILWHKVHFLSRLTFLPVFLPHNKNTPRILSSLLTTYYVLRTMYYVLRTNLKLVHSMQYVVCSMWYVVRGTQYVVSSDERIRGVFLL